MTLERTLVLIKHDGLAKGLVCADLTPTPDLKIICSRQVRPSIELAQLHYEEHKDQLWFRDITEALSSGEVMAVVIESENAVRKMRNLIGNRTNPDTIRGKFSNPDIKHENAIHGSDSVKSADREISLWFPDITSALSC